MERASKERLRDRIRSKERPKRHLAQTLPKQRLDLVPLRALGRARPLTVRKRKLRLRHRKRAKRPVWLRRSLVDHQVASI